MSDNQPQDDARPDPPAQPLYLPLLEGQAIRLVELAPGTPSDPVAIRLFIFELGHHPQYEALSYVWGSPENTVTILCNGRNMDVTVNLNAAFVRVRYPDRPRMLWADAVCINQRHLKERSHHVSFMGNIYKHAWRVLLCFGKDLDGGAGEVAALVQENADLVSKYDSILDMPILPPDDPLFDDPRWKNMATFIKCPWFTRAWVLQEVGLADDPRVLYGDVEFSYRDLMRLAIWVTRCAPNLEPRASVSFFSIHTDWLDWSPDWRKTSTYPNETFLVLLNHARWLACREWRDHIYAFLGHPLAQLDGGPRTVVIPDYSKPVLDVYLELAIQLLQSNGVRVLCPVEHTEQTLAEDFPSWVPFCRDVELTSCTFGIHSSFYYDASSGAQWSPPTVVETNCLEVRGTVVDVVTKTYQFSALDLEDPDTTKSDQPETSQKGTLSHIWADTQDNQSTCAYSEEERLSAFSLTLCAGLSTYKSAEDNLEQHNNDFAAYWNLQHSLTPDQALLQARATQGDPEKFLLDMKLVCEGRSFLCTEKGYYGLGPCIARPGDLCCVLFGANVPFLLRRVDGARCKLVGEAFVHGLMRGEAAGMVRRNVLREEVFVVC
ncbi:MAG: hypothetical protein M1839_001701 [Geoglossum umbratile]|nr:MAG: hypothetical protein M1839_001701 [Geoglossum umbratile]